MGYRTLNIDFDGNKFKDVKLIARLDEIYKSLFQQARRCAKRNPEKIEHGIKVIIFGCFLLEARFNSLLRFILEHESKSTKFSLSLWSVLKRSNYNQKLKLISTFLTQSQRQKFNDLSPKLERVFDLRNRLAHFKNETEIITKSAEIENVMQIINDFPLPDIYKELKWDKIKEYANIISGFNILLNNILRSYYKRYNLSRGKVKKRRYRKFIAIKTNLKRKI